jgi:hypothetical protein
MVLDHKSTTNEALQWSGVTFSSMVTKNYNLLIKCPREYNPRTIDKKVTKTYQYIS